MNSPDFILIGSAKCGTSSLWSTLGDHPEIFALQGIEVQFFSLDSNYERGWQWYIDHFPEQNERVRLIGENSNRYTMREQYPHSAARMARHLPNAKLIFIVRHPDFKRTGMERSDILVDSTSYLWQDQHARSTDSHRLP